MPSNKKLISEISSICLSSNLHIITVESCTGGLLAAELTKFSGSSKFFEKGYITYSNQSKEDLAGVPKKLIEQYGAVSSEVVAAMATNTIKEDNHKTISIAISGVAGPEKSENKPVGLVWLGFYHNKKLSTKKLNFGDKDRRQIRQKSVSEGLEFLYKCLIKMYY